MMTPEEIINKQTWEILQDIKEEYLAHGDDVSFAYDISRTIIVAGDHSPTRDRKEAIIKNLARKEKAIHIVREIQNEWLTRTRGFEIMVIQPQFDKVYEKYENALNPTNFLNKYQESRFKKDKDLPEFGKIESIKKPTEEVKTNQKEDQNILSIFYSWQSDLSNKTNRTLIEDALDKAIKNIRNDTTIKVVPRLDKDTQGTSGSPHIMSTILDKIDKAFMVVSDVTIVGKLSNKRPSPNPNVLFELGYAVHALGFNKIIMVQNTKHGDIKKLPFDLQSHKVTQYSCKDTDEPKVARDQLEKDFERSIRFALKNNTSKTKPEHLPPVGEKIKIKLKEGTQIKWGNYSQLYGNCPSFRVFLDINNFKSAKPDYIKASLRSIDTGWTANHFVFDQANGYQDKAFKISPRDIDENVLVHISNYVMERGAPDQPMPELGSSGLVLHVSTESGSEFDIDIPVEKIARD